MGFFIKNANSRAGKKPVNKMFTQNNLHSPDKMTVLHSATTASHSAMTTSLAFDCKQIKNSAVRIEN